MASPVISYTDEQVMARINARFDPPPRPRVMTGREIRAKAGRDARTAAAKARRAACKHAQWRRMYSDPCGMRCASCGAVRIVASREERDTLCAKAPGQPPIRYPFKGESLTIYELSGRFQIPWSTLYGWINRGISVERAVTLKSKRRRLDSRG